MVSNGGVDSVLGAAFLSEKVAFVAGGLSGINAGIAEGLGRAGDAIALISQSVEKIEEEAAASLRKSSYQAIGMSEDIRDFVELASAQGEYGPVEIVISGHTGNFLVAAQNMFAIAFKTITDIDLLGTFNFFRASYRYLCKLEGSLIAITAGQAVQPIARQVQACTAKAGVDMVTKCLALEGEGRCARECNLAQVNRRDRRYAAADPAGRAEGVVVAYHSPRYIRPDMGHRRAGDFPGERKCALHRQDDRRLRRGCNAIAGRRTLSARCGMTGNMNSGPDGHYHAI